MKLWKFLIASMAPPVLDDAIIGELVDILYPDVGRFTCEVLGYCPETSWHKIISVPNSEKSSNSSEDVLFSLNKSTNQLEEQFTDEIDLNLWFREKKVYFRNSLMKAVCHHCDLQIVNRKFLFEGGRHVFHASCWEEIGSRSVVSPMVQIKIGGKRVRSLSMDALLPPAEKKLRKSSASSVVKCKHDLIVNGEWCFLDAQQYLSWLCHDSIDTAMNGLISSALTNLHFGENSPNYLILKSALSISSSNPTPYKLLVAVRTDDLLYPSNRHNGSSVKDLVYGFGAYTITGDSDYTGDKSTVDGKVLLYTARSSHVRTIEELRDVLNSTHWIIYDEIHGITYHNDILVDEITDSYTGINIYKEETINYILSGLKISHNRHHNTRHHCHMQKQESITISRSSFNPKQFKLITNGHTTNAHSHSSSFIASPSRLLFGEMLKSMCLVVNNMITLELALPINGLVKTHGMGRRVQYVIDSTQPEMVNKLTMETTSNISAYKLYRSFGFGEHYTFNQMNINQNKEEYKYPVMACNVKSWQGQEGDNNIGSVVDKIVRKEIVMKGSSSMDEKCKKPAMNKEDKMFMKELSMLEVIIDRLGYNRLYISPDTILNRGHYRLCKRKQIKYAGVGHGGEGGTSTGHLGESGRNQQILQKVGVS
jgi:hypothetical protein